MQMSKHQLNNGDEAPQLSFATQPQAKRSPTTEAPRCSSNMKYISCGPAATPSCRVRTHHFPLYSHPMFRAAIFNSDAVRRVLEAEAEQMDHVALEDAVDHMVDELVREQEALATTPARGEGRKNENCICPVVSEEQLLALLASVSLKATKSGDAAAQSASLSPRPQLPPLLSQPPIETFASTAGLKMRPLPHSTRQRASLPPPQQQQQKVLNALHSNNKSEVQVVSVKALQKAAVTYTRRTSQTDGALQSAPTFSSVDAAYETTYASSIPHGHASLRKEKAPTSIAADLHFSSNTGAAVVSPFAPSLSRPPCIANVAHTKPTSKTKRLYSLLPMSSVNTSNGGVSSNRYDAQIASGDASHGVTFAEMDRRPGIGTGPVAQQSVDTQHLNGVSDAVFAAMDVLMDGNSCCVRRRQRGPRKQGGQSASRVAEAKPSTLMYQSGVNGGLCFSAYPLCCSTVSLSSPLPPRTAAEAKARRILEAQRRRQRASGPTHNTATVVGAAPDAKQLFLNASQPTSHNSASRATATGETGVGNQNALLPPLSTVHDTASQLPYVQAVNFAHNAGLNE